MGEGVTISIHETWSLGCPRVAEPGPWPEPGTAGLVPGKLAGSQGAG